jgi:hypothetical protein
MRFLNWLNFDVTVAIREFQSNIPRTSVQFQSAAAEPTPRDDESQSDTLRA